MAETLRGCGISEEDLTLSHVGRSCSEGSYSLERVSLRIELNQFGPGVCTLDGKHLSLSALLFRLFVGNSGITENHLSISDFPCEGIFLLQGSGSISSGLSSINYGLGSGGSISFGLSSKSVGLGLAARSCLLAEGPGSRVAIHVLPLLPFKRGTVVRSRIPGVACAPV